MYRLIESGHEEKSDARAQEPDSTPAKKKVARTGLNVSCPRNMISPTDVLRQLSTAQAGLRAGFSHGLSGPESGWVRPKKRRTRTGLNVSCPRNMISPIHIVCQLSTA
jgi:hypothetical protein